MTQRLILSLHTHSFCSNSLICSLAAFRSALRVCNSATGPNFGRHTLQRKILPQHWLLAGVTLGFRCNFPKEKTDGTAPGLSQNRWHSTLPAWKVKGLPGRELMCSLWWQNKDVRLAWSDTRHPLFTQISLCQKFMKVQLRTIISPADAHRHTAVVMARPHCRQRTSEAKKIHKVSAAATTRAANCAN